jgi:single-strand DNA-binding protein
MASLNKVILIGNVGKDPEIRQLDNGFKIAKFSLATHETYKSKDGVKGEQTEWHNVVVLRDGLAEIAKKFITKGKQLYVEGRIRTRNWTDKEGIRKNLTEIVAENFIMLGNRRVDGTVDNENNGLEHLPESPHVVEEPSTDMTL